jgi:hypothetical protein
MKAALWDDKPTAAKAEVAAGYLVDGEMYMPQMETAEERDGCMQAAAWMHDNRPKIWQAVITNLYNERLDPSLAAYLAERGIAAMPEGYANDNQAWYNNPVGMLYSLIADCHRLGYKLVTVLVGVYHDYGLSRYQLNRFTASWNYLAETMTDRTGDWSIVWP